MPRPHKKRIVRHSPASVHFKPQGVPLSRLREVVLGFDEYEAIRLADHVGLSQADIGREMGISRATAGRIVERARNKVATALVEGLALRIEGGPAQRCSDAPPAAVPVPGPPSGAGRGRGRRGRGGRGRGGRGRGGCGGPPWS